MKKIYLLLLLAASLCFADWNVVTQQTYSFGCKGSICGDGYRFAFLNTYSNQPVNGFKVSIFFNAAPGSDFEMEARRVLVNEISYGNTQVTVVEGDNSILPLSTQLVRISAVQYKVVFDYSHITIPARGRFPAEGQLRLRAYNTEEDPIRDNWMPYGHTLRGYVIESPSGVVLTANSHYTPDPSRRIGLLVSDSRCPDYDSNNPQTLLYAIKIDAEDNSPQTRIVSGDQNPLGITLPAHDIKFRYCGLWLTQMPKVSYDYIVLKMDSECPAGSYPMMRYHDAEDNNNANVASRYIWPNVVNTDATLEYCFVPRNSSSSKKYPFDNKAYGVFANPGSNVSPYIAHTEIYVDDEDNGNANWWYLDEVPSVYHDRVRAIMSGDKNTTYHVIKWTGSMMAKSAEVADNSVSSAYVAAAPLAPAIKGLNRSVVSVELKSAGDAKISVVNVNGAQIANVVEKNLQPGVHQIKWNSGMVPSGRYIVKVEQNGMVNAKNVILK